jgi:hypothetical protein
MALFCPLFKIRLSQSGKTLCPPNDDVTIVSPHYQPAGTGGGGIGTVPVPVGEEWGMVPGDESSGGAGSAGYAAGRSRKLARKERFNRNFWGPNFTPAGKTCLILSGRAVSTPGDTNPFALARKINAQQQQQQQDTLSTPTIGRGAASDSTPKSARGGRKSLFGEHKR